MFEGLGTAVITPFKNGEIDLLSFKKLLDYQICNGVKHIIVCGSTGETSNLTEKEQYILVDESVKFCNGKHINVIAGSSSMNTSTAIQLGKRNKELGANGILVSVPPYNKPMQTGLFQHFQSIADEVKIPVILYNVPERTARDLSNETIIKLSFLDYIVALKDASGDLSRIPELRKNVKRDFTLLSGEDSMALGFNAMGGKGVISVSANVAPKLCSELQKYSLKNNFTDALKIQDALVELNSLMFCETNPIPVRYACSLLGFGDSLLRLPLTELEEKNKEKIKNLMQKMNLI